MLGSGPPCDGIIRTSPGQECSKDKGALPGARRISVYASRSWSRARQAPSRWFTSRCLILCLVAERVSLYSAKRRCARSSMDRASDYGSEGWGFESLRARSGPPRCDPPVGVLHLWTAPLRGCFSIARPALAVVPRLLGPAAFDAGALSFRAGRRAGGCGLVDASGAGVIHIGETRSALALVGGRVRETGSALAFRNCRQNGTYAAAGVGWVSRGRGYETETALALVGGCVYETETALVFRNCRQNGTYAAAGVVWVSCGCGHAAAGVVWVSCGCGHAAAGVVWVSPGRVHGAAGVVWVSRGNGGAAARVVWVSRGCVHETETALALVGGRCVKPEPPLPSENAAKTAHGPRQGWSGFHVSAYMKPRPPLSSENAPKTAHIS